MKGVAFTGHLSPRIGEEHQPNENRYSDYTGHLLPNRKCSCHCRDRRRLELHRYRLDCEQIPAWY